MKPTQDIGPNHLIELSPTALAIADMYQRRSLFELHDAWDDLKAGTTKLTFDDLCALFELIPDTYARTEIVDLMGRSSDQRATAVLRQYLQRRIVPLVRYIVILNLIDQGVSDWKPKRKSQLESEFYQSLIAFERYVRGETTLEALHTLARSQFSGPRSHWEWLTVYGTLDESQS